jgi:hypothetical protein
MPLQWQAARLTSMAALRSLALSGWLSGCGALLVLREMRVPALQRWLRRHFRFVTSSSGRQTLHLFAATLAFTSGGVVGFALGTMTLANYLFGRRVRRKVAAAKREATAAQLPPLRVAAPAEAPASVLPPSAPLADVRQGAAGDGQDYGQGVVGGEQDGASRPLECAEIPAGSDKHSGVDAGDSGNSGYPTEESNSKYSSDGDRGARVGAAVDDSTVDYSDADKSGARLAARAQPYDASASAAQLGGHHGGGARAAARAAPSAGPSAAARMAARRPDAEPDHWAADIHTDITP